METRWLIRYKCLCSLTAVKVNLSNYSTKQVSATAPEKSSYFTSLILMNLVANLTVSHSPTLKWETSERQVQTSENELETSADEWDLSENASPFARWFQMLESLHIAETDYWFNV